MHDGMHGIYKVLHPDKYFNDYLTEDNRPDGRKFNDHRNVKLNVNCIGTSETSAVVKCGNTTVICGIQLELVTPKPEEPDLGFMIVNVEMPSMSSNKIRPGPPSDHAQVINNVVSDIILNSKCVDLKDLCIVHDKLAWVLHCDAICMDNDGSLVDACVIGLMTCLKTLSLPTVKFDPETEEIKVDEVERIPLKISGLPVATSFCLLEQNKRIITLTEPTSFEEEMCGGVGAHLIVSWNESLLIGMQKFGGCNLTPENQKEAMKIAKIRSKLIHDIIDTCIKNKSKK
ncbi:exosome complex component RRP43-like [Epargyreus clarus]|uniref:exosome complex component RRP43-like n=1 Tax=Epargyreus clarus TaxID=520877 RepID=UPI003C2D9784